MNLDQVRAVALGKWRRVMCVDGYPRKLKLDHVESDRCGGWYVAGLDSNGIHHGSYLRNDHIQGWTR